MRYHDVDNAIARIARRQHGAFSLAQARGAGTSGDVVMARVATGAWIRLAPGVYALPSNPFTWHRQCMAATLGERAAVVSGRAAAALHGFAGFRPGRVEVTVPRGRNHRSDLAVIHQSDLVEATRVDGIAVVTMAQALIEVARYRSERRLGELLDELDARHRGRTLPAVQERYVDLARSRWPGIRTVRAVLAERDEAGFVPPESLLEAKLWAVLKRLPDAPGMIRQADLPWREAGTSRVDVLIPDWRAIVEADGRRWHTRVNDFEVDRERDNEAVLHGFRPLRFTWRQVTERPRYVLAAVERLRAAAFEEAAYRRSGVLSAGRRSVA